MKNLISKGKFSTHMKLFCHFLHKWMYIHNDRSSLAWIYILKSWRWSCALHLHIVGYARTEKVTVNYVNNLQNHAIYTIKVSMCFFCLESSYAYFIVHWIHLLLCKLFIIKSTHPSCYPSSSVVSLSQHAKVTHYIQQKFIPSYSPFLVVNFLSVWLAKKEGVTY